MLNFYLSLTNRNMATRRNVTGSVNTTGRTPIQYPPEPEFTSNLTSSLIPSASVWTITYTRATIATVINNEWIIKYVKSGEARFQGARRVENLFSYSEDASNAYWSKVRASVTANAIAWPSGNLIADLVVGTVAGSSYIYTPMSVIAGNKYRVSVCVKAADVTNFNITSFTQVGTCGFDLALGLPAAPTGIASLPTMTNLWNGWYRCSILFTANATGSNNIGCVYQNYVWNICYVCEMQMEDVTGQSDTSFGGYVSTNVLSAPYHWAMVDGVKYFDTDINGTPIPDSTLKGFLCEWARTNLFLQSEDFSTTWAITGGWSMTTNIWIAPDGKNTMDLFIPSVTAGLQYISQSVTTIASVYVYSVYVKANGYNLVQLWASWSISSWYVNFDLSTGTVTASSLWTGSIQSVWNGIYRCTATTDTVTAATSVFTLQPIATPTTPRATPFTGDWVSGLLVWWAQLERWPNVSSYIPTTTTAVTRNTDSLVYTVANVVSNRWACSAIISLPDTAQFDRKAIGLSSNTNNRLQFQAKISWTANANLLYGDGASVLSITASQEISSNNIVFAWTNGVDVSLYLNNTKYISAGVPNLTLTTVDVGSTGWLSTFGSLKNFRLWKTRPTDTELLFLSNNP